MTQRIRRHFDRLRAENEGAFVPFLVLGDPAPDATLPLVRALLAGGADMLEFGLAYSDPPADGPVIQAADQRALAAGMDTAKALTLLGQIRSETDVPIALLVYYNLILQFGPEAFFRQAEAAGVDAVLIADLPLDHAEHVRSAAAQAPIALVPLVSPLTTDARLQTLLTLGADGYIYVVAQPGVTGERSALAPQLEATLTQCRAHSDLPRLVGFGISSPEHVAGALRAGADGAISGSAIVRRIADHGAPTPSEHPEQFTKLCEALESFTRAMKQATRRP